jgi:hypothetical protein
MKNLFCLIFLFFPPVLQQDHPPAPVCRPEIKYDRSTNITTVQCDLIEEVGDTGRLIVSAGAAFQGKEPQEPAQFWLELASYRGKATRRTPAQFKEARTLYLTLDSARLEVPVNNYHNELFELNRLLAERARAEIGREDLQKLVNARQLEGKWGVVEFKFSVAALNSLKDFISRQTPMGTGR